MDNRRTTIVTNKKFQYQFSLMIVVLAVLSVNGFLIFRALYPGDQMLLLSFSQVLAIGVLEAILVGGVWWASLKLSNRVAGPVFVFVREIGKLGEGDLTAKIRLRKADMFADEAESMNNSIAALRKRIARAKELTGKVQQAQQEGAEIEPVIAELASELAQFNTADEN